MGGYIALKVKKYFEITSKAKINVFEIFSSDLKGTYRLSLMRTGEKFPNMLILATFEVMMTHSSTFFIELFFHF